MDSGLTQVPTAAINLEAGETAIISSGHIDINSPAHNISTTVKMCSGEGLSGSCLVKTIPFLP